MKNNRRLTAAITLALTLGVTGPVFAEVQNMDMGNLSNPVAVHSGEEIQGLNDSITVSVSGDSTGDGVLAADNGGKLTAGGSNTNTVAIRAVENVPTAVYAESNGNVTVNGKAISVYAESISPEIWAKALGVDVSSGGSVNLNGSSVIVETKGGQGEAVSLSNGGGSITAGNGDSDSSVTLTTNGSKASGISSWGGQTVLKGNTISIQTTSTGKPEDEEIQNMTPDAEGIDVYEDGTVTLNGKTITINTTSQNGLSRGITAKDEKTVTVGSADTDKVEITSSGKISSEGIATGVDKGDKGGSVTVKGKNINVQAYGSEEQTDTDAVRAEEQGVITLGDDTTDSVKVNATGKSTFKNALNGRGGTVNVNGREIELGADGGAQTVLASHKGKVNIGGASTEQVKVTASDEGYAVALSSENGEINVKGKNITVVSKVTGHADNPDDNDVNAVTAWPGGTVNIGDANTDTVNISASAEQMARALATSTLESSPGARKISVQGKNITVTASAPKGEADAVLTNGLGTVEVGSSETENLTVNAQGKDFATALFTKKMNADTGGTILADGQNIILSADASEGDAHTVYAADNGKITLGSDAAQTVSVKAKAKKNATGLTALSNGQVEVKGGTLDIQADAETGSAIGIRTAAGTTVNGKEATEGKVTVNAQNTIIRTNAQAADPNKSDGPQSIGILADKGTEVTVNNNLTVNPDAADPYQTTAVRAEDNASVAINPTGSGTVKLNGNIDFAVPESAQESAAPSVSINLNNAASYLNGNAPVRKNAAKRLMMRVANRAVWNTSGNSSVDNLTLENGGQVNLGGAAHTVEVSGTVNGSGGVVTTDSTASRLVAQNNRVNNLSVSQNGVTADDMQNNPNLAQQVADVAQDSSGKSIASQVKAPEGIVNGAFTANVDRTSGKIMAAKVEKNPSNAAFTRQAALNLITWRQENNDLNKRLGEVRDSKEADGIWARMSRGEVTHKDIHNQYNYYQLGYDRKIGNNWILGGAVSYTDGDSYHGYGKADNNHTGFAVYGSQLNPDGSYIDLIVKYARLRNKFDLTGGIGHGDYDNNAFALSAEYGKRFTNKNGFWIEPQAELTYGCVDSADFYTKNGANVHQDSLDSLVGRIGFSVGKNIKAGNIYARVSFLDDFQGDIDTRVRRNGAFDSFHDDIGGSWWEYGLGTNLNLGSNSHFYLDLERAMGGEVATNWQWNAGFRFDF